MAMQPTTNKFIDWIVGFYQLCFYELSLWVLSARKWVSVISLLCFSLMVCLQIWFVGFLAFEQKVLKNRHICIGVVNSVAFLIIDCWIDRIYLWKSDHSLVCDLVVVLFLTDIGDWNGYSWYIAFSVAFFWQAKIYF